MECLRSRAVWLTSVVVMIMILMDGVESRQPFLHRVGGGRFTWAPNINFTEWSSKELFYVGDWLYFGFDKHIYNVLEVNKTSYDNCTETDYVFNVTRGGRDVFNLTEAKTYYFLSGRGYCYKGMKVTVIAQQIPPEQILQHSSGTKTHSYGTTNYIILLLAMLFNST